MEWNTDDLKALEALSRWFLVEMALMCAIPNRYFVDWPKARRLRSITLLKAHFVNSKN